MIPITKDQRLAVAVEVARSFHGTPYIWGGDDPSGFDCSGLIVEILQSVNLLRHGTDFTADGIYKIFGDCKVPEPYQGCLACYHNKAKTRIGHIEFCINRELTIGASGGGSKTTTLGKAIKDNAFVKYRPIYRRLNVVFVDPFKASPVYLP